MNIKNKGITKSNGQKHQLDKFYTKPEIALECINRLDLSYYSYVIEPSAGSGSFSKQINNCIAMDILPEDDTIVQQNWLLYSRKRDVKNKTIVLGNPPFGQQNNLALKFINHAAQFADTIAFILPKSFMKESLQNAINHDFVLEDYWILPKDSFTLNGESADVPCVFQVWKYSPENRRSITSIRKIKGVDFVKKTQDPNLYIQRIGGRAGTAGTNVLNRSDQSNYFIKLDTSLISIEDFVTIVNSTVFSVKDLSVGPRSISKRELVNGLLESSDLLVEHI
jgi:predicted RNA methylase